jgi:DNA-binding CsgD family transcriptional regulator
MTDPDQLLEIVSAIAEGPFESPLWANFLNQLRTATAADYAILSFRPPGRPFDESVTLISAATSLTVEDVSREDLPPGDPPVDETLVEGRPYAYGELLGRRNTAVWRAYIEYLARTGAVRLRHMRVQEASGVHAWLTIVRNAEHEFTPDDAALIASLARALRASLRQYVALERERFQASLTAEPVRQLEFGWITLDAAGAVLDCDEQGAKVLRESGVLGRNARGRLTAHMRELEREIFEALERVTSTPKARPYAITLCREPWLDMLLAPSRAKSISAKATPAAIAYVHGDSWRLQDRCQQLSQLFRLSPQEARLALALCRGMSIAEAATEFGLAIGTARNYSKAIFAKMGARGQSDLVRIIMRSVLAIAPQW